MDDFNRKKNFVLDFLIGFYSSEQTELNLRMNNSYFQFCFTAKKINY
jgi:hypothetical protein